MALLCGPNASSLWSSGKLGGLCRVWSHPGGPSDPRGWRSHSKRADDEVRHWQGKFDSRGLYGSSGGESKKLSVKNQAVILRYVCFSIKLKWLSNLRQPWVVRPHAWIKLQIQANSIGFLSDIVSHLTSITLQIQELKVKIALQLSLLLKSTYILFCFDFYYLFTSAKFA